METGRRLARELYGYVEATEKVGIIGICHSQRPHADVVFLAR